MGNLHVSSINSVDPRPFQNGNIAGTKNGVSHQANKEWLVDTGASVSAITKSNADQFDLIATGASASATTGGGGIIMKSGLTMVFTVLDEATGSDNSVGCSLDVGVKPNDNGSEILGMDQVVDVGASIRWDPKAQDGDLYQ